MSMLVNWKEAKKAAYRTMVIKRPLVTYRGGVQPGGVHGSRASFEK
jgi:hypothetical protein